MNKVRFHTLGCKLNQSESNQISNILSSAGIAKQIQRGEENPDIVFINSCAVTGKAAAKSRHAINRLVKENPDSIVIVTGCLAQLDPEGTGSIPGVDYVLGIDERFSTDWWQGKPEQSIVSVSSDPFRMKADLEMKSLNRARPFLKIQDGCDHFCTYCIIPLLRGTCRSLPAKEVLLSARRMVDLGADEIVLTGVRIGAWGKDLKGGESFKRLLCDLTAIDGLRRIRLGSIEPWEIDEELIKFVIDSPKICNHLHVPIQHTSKDVLRTMGRPRLDSTLELLVEAKKSNPLLGFGIDVILGFPGETEDDFNQLVSDISNLPITYLHAFGYSERPGTKASTLKNKQLPAVIKRRVTEVTNIGQEKRVMFSKQQIGRICFAIPDNVLPNQEYTSAITGNYLRLKLKSAGLTGGKCLRVRIDHELSDNLIGIPNN
ncbi:MAG: MiaB/RimO family radical SAM methylthiotransferase [SAR324 cluster bacterium]|nr:MiaB/RimO family radical SAM methylthiotransferase [SAR324 cluster bacterium]